MDSNYLLLCLLILFVIQYSHFDGITALKSEKLCSMCSNCDSSQCPASEAYPHMTAFDDRLIAGALQSNYVDSNDRRLYSVPDVKSGLATTWTSAQVGKVTSQWTSKASIGKCLTVFPGKTTKHIVGVAECKFDGSNVNQLFAFCFHYHKAFCCCGVHNE
ncbi:hypothetical protein Q3G72_032064 [Acer saccharum]|nr:hypothetical protein Q3G72_032064 [Acer saccharum]